ncbi:NF-kappa-B inhibitor alpha [Cytospora mali]|uniref:NF-kappa-B inhibitor alpha n=1 Tax=Cytospora mali TaxID=578113 RepID=A0A194VI27_CYTMA|nr:NF-kappa-B inhibitor alpha [Valsa mali]
MALSPNNDERLSRLRKLSQEYNIEKFPEPMPFSKPSNTPSPLATNFKDSDAEQKADELLRQRRLANTQDHSGVGGSLKRPFALARRDSFASKEIFDALDAHVASAGAPAVADALLYKLRQAGGDLNRTNTRSKTPFNLRRKSLENLGQEQSRILQKAVENGQEDMVAVLVPHADPATIDAALPLALRTGNVAITEILLQYGANLSQTPEGLFQFRQMCMNGGQADMVGLLLRSDGRPTPDWISGGMIDAAKKGCVDTVARLSRSVADGSFDNGAALKEAVSQCRVDIALAIILGRKPPNKQCLNEAFANVQTHPTMKPPEKVRFADVLLLAGAEGDVVSEALVKACDTEFDDMIRLLVSSGASIEFKGALVVENAIKRGNLSLVQTLLSEGAILNPTIAADLTGKIPMRMSPENRRILLSIILRKGAKGAPVNDALINAVESGDIECVKLLLTANYFSHEELPSKANRQILRKPRSMANEWHAVADVNHKGGLALLKAVQSRNLPIVDFIVAAKPAVETLVAVFPSIKWLEPTERYSMTESFLNAGVSGPCVHAALQEAIDETPPRRDDRLIKLLLQNDVNADANDAAPLVSAIGQQDIGLLEALLRKRPTTARNASMALTRAMTVDHKDTRLRMASLLLQAGANEATETVNNAIKHVLHEQPTDIQLLGVLLQQGNDVINVNKGDAVVLAVRNENPQVLEVILQTGRATAETMALAVQAAANLPSSKEKANKIESILKCTTKKENLNSLLVSEVQAMLHCPPQQRTLAVLETLLAAGVDVNANKAAALCLAVANRNSTITDILIAAQPSPQSLAAAMPHAYRIADQAERLTFVQKLLNAGAPAAEANRALVYAVGKESSDVALINTLVTRADTSDGEALMQAVKGANVLMVELLITKAKKHLAARINEAFVEAARIEDKEVRRSICELLLKAGASGQVVSDALLSTARAGDLELGNMLMSYGATLDHQEGQAVVEACRAGSSDVLKMLLSSRTAIKKETLERGFQAATEAGDLNKRGAVFRLLLDKGVSGKVVDEQLVSAGRYGDDAIDLVRLLLQYGASPDYNGGEAVYNATRSAFLGILEVMLAIMPVNDKQQKPSTETMIRALKASSKLSSRPKYQVVEWLFTAGLPVREEAHAFLNQAVNEEEPSIDLIKLLLAHGASPLTNCCKSLVDAARDLRPAILDLFLQVEIPNNDIAWAFSQAFVPNAAELWLSEPGLEVAQRLLEKGACGDGLAKALIVAIDHICTDKTDIALRFVDLLVQYDTDVNQGEGEAVIKAAKSANTHLLEKLLQRRPNSNSVSMAFPYVFDHDVSEEQALELVKLFTDYRDGETQLDPMFPHPQCEPIIFKAISRYPRSTRITQTLLDAGYYHDQMTSARIFDNIEEQEQVSLLLWCLLQPQKKVSSGIIALLIERGARVNFETRISKTTPLMLAIKERRHDIVKQLVFAGAEVDVVDITGNTPLTLTTQIGGDLGTTMMKNVLAAEPSQNDGSLHNAARELNLPAMQVLVDFGHEVDFPSPLHGGRTALGELCLHAADNGALTAAQEKAVDKAISYLMKQGTDLSLHSDGRSVLLLAMESLDPVVTTRALLKVGMWKHINQPFNQFTSGGYTYSPTEYVKRVLPQSDVTEQLHTLLQVNRGQDVYYANDGPQPEGATGLPDDIVRAERERKARLERIRLEAEDHARTLARTKEVADIQNQILMQRAQLEDARSRQQRSTEVEGIRERAQLEEELFNEAVRRQRAERASAMQHQASLTQAEVSRRRLVADAEFEAEGRKQLQMLEYEKHVNSARENHARQMSTVRVDEREKVDRLDREHDSRIKNRIVQQKKLLDSQNQLAANLSGVGMPQRRQIGYISGELD